MKPPKKLCHFTLLQKLDLSNNKLTEFPQEIFKKCTYLHSIDFENNQLTQLPSIPENYRINQLNLSGNPVPLNSLPNQIGKAPLKIIYSPCSGSQFLQLDIGHTYFSDGMC